MESFQQRVYYRLVVTLAFKLVNTLLFALNRPLVKKGYVYSITVLKSVNILSTLKVSSAIIFLNILMHYCLELKRYRKKTLFAIQKKPLPG